MVSARQRSVDFFVRYAIVGADRQGVTGPLESWYLHLFPYFSTTYIFMHNNTRCSISYTLRPACMVSHT